MQPKCNSWSTIGQQSPKRVGCKMLLHRQLIRWLPWWRRPASMLSGCGEQDRCGRQQTACSCASSCLSLADPSLPGRPHSACVLHLAWLPRPASDYSAQSSATHHASLGCRCSMGHCHFPFMVRHAHLAHGRNEHRHCQPLPCMAGVCTFPMNSLFWKLSSSCWFAVGSRASPSRLKLRLIWLTFIMHLGMSLKHRHERCSSCRSVTMEAANGYPPPFVKSSSAGSRQVSAHVQPELPPLPKQNSPVIPHGCL